MGYKFSAQSLKNLSECHLDLQALFNAVAKVVDCSILDGHRPKEEQDKAFNAGKSKKEWPDSLHNKFPSLAIDAAPYPIDWNDMSRFYYFAGVVKGVASELGINIRWGGDWDGDNDFQDQTFNDLVHFELIGDEYANS